MPDVEYINFNEQEDESIALTNKLKDLIKSGVKPSEITILSPFKFDQSVASKVTKYKIDLVSLESDNITYSTIQAFKGLENKVIILTDIKTYRNPDLMYVAMSRARSMLIVFETPHATERRKELL